MNRKNAGLPVEVATLFWSAPISQVTPVASLSTPSISILTPLVVPKSTPASKHTELVSKCKSSEPPLVETKSISDNVLFARDPVPRASYAVADVSSDRL